MSEPVAQMLERLAALLQSHGSIMPLRPEGGGNNDGTVKDPFGHVFADCRGFEGRAELFAALHNAAPQLIRLVRAGEALAEALRADHESTPREDDALAAWDEAAREGANG